MAIENSGTISMGDTAGTNRSIFQEKTGFTRATVQAQNLSLRGFSVDGIDDYEDEDADGVDVAGSPNQTAPYRMSEFYGYASTFATTYYSSTDAYSFAPDSNTEASIKWRAFYSGSDIKVQVTGGEELTPSDGTEVYRITGAPSGYTVRYGTFTHNEDIPTVSGTMSTSATSIPTAPSDKNVELRIESGGGFEDPGSAFATGSGSLIFEKSGSTTFTYSFSYQLEAETEGSGGE